MIKGGFEPAPVEKRACDMTQPICFMKAGGRKHGSPIYHLVCDVLNVAVVKRQW